MLDRFPKGSKIKLYVGDVYKSGEVVEVYYYDKLNSNLELYKENIVIKNGFLELEPTNYNNYFVTKLLTEDIETDTTTIGASENSNNFLPKVLTLVLVAVVIALIIVASVLYCKKYNINLFRKLRRR